MGRDDDVTSVEILNGVTKERDAAYDAIRDLVHATAGHVGCSGWRGTRRRSSRRRPRPVTEACPPECPCRVDWKAKAEALTAQLAAARATSTRLNRRCSSGGRPACRRHERRSRGRPAGEGEEKKVKGESVGHRTAWV
jgi:hypothetical protein